MARRTKAELERARVINWSKERLDRETIKAIPAPERTKTWNPISHGEVLEALDMVIRSQGVGIREESYSIANSGLNLFGTWTLDITMEGSGGRLVQVGFRNSLKKTFAVGICAGTHVIACSNLMFNGEFLEFRKHTGRLDFDELLVTANTAFAGVIAQSTELNQWQNALEMVPVKEDQHKVLTYEALDAGILPPNRFKEYQRCYEEEVELAEGKRTLSQFHGAITRMSRDLNLFTVSGRMNQLQTLCNAFMA